MKTLSKFLTTTILLTILSIVVALPITLGLEYILHEVGVITRFFPLWIGTSLITFGGFLKFVIDLSLKKEIEKNI